jgi:hypothetical protein
VWRSKLWGMLIGDPRAGGLLQQTYDLWMEKADRISDKAMRRSFLGNVP